MLIKTMYLVLSEKKFKFNRHERNIIKGYHDSGHFKKAKCKNK